MISRPAIRPTWPLLALAATLLVTVTTQAQTPLPKNPVPATAVSFIPASFTNESVAATVNGEKILVGEVKKILEQRPYPTPLSEEQKKQVRQAALEVLVEDVVLRQYLTKQVPQVSQADFNKEVQDFEAALKATKKSLKEELEKSGQTEEQLRRDIIAKLQWKALLKRYYPDEKLKSYYDANKPFFDKVYVKASHILIKLPANATKEQRDQAMNQILVWRQDILAGKARFEDVAKKHSDCPSKDKGGDIGEFPYKFVVVPEFARAAFAMKPGEVSNVVQTTFGLHIILVTARKPGENSNFEALKDMVREVWAQDDELYQRVLTDHRKASDVKIILP